MRLDEKLEAVSKEVEELEKRLGEIPPLEAGKEEDGELAFVRMKTTALLKEWAQTQSDAEVSGWPPGGLCLFLFSFATCLGNNHLGSFLCRRYETSLRRTSKRFCDHDFSIVSLRASV